MGTFSVAGCIELALVMLLLFSSCLERTRSSGMTIEAITANTKLPMSIDIEMIVPFF